MHTQEQLEMLAENRARWSCRIAGVKPVGVQRMYGTRPDQFLFQVRDGNTLAVSLFDITPISIAYRVAEYHAERSGAA